MREDVNFDRSADFGAAGAKFVAEVDRVDYVGVFDLDTHEPVGLMRLVWGTTTDKKDALDSQYLDPATGLWVQSGEVLDDVPTEVVNG